MSARKPAAGVAAHEQAWNGRALRAPPRPSWRVWRYREPALVLGVSQRELQALAAAAPLAVLRRRAGGGAVLAGPWMLGLSVALPAGHALARDGLLACYRWLGQALAQALSFGGAHCRALAPHELGARPAAARDWACFGSLSPWEVVCDGRKIAGLAQVRTPGCVLLAAGVLLQRPDWELLCRALRQPPREALRLERATIDWQQAARLGGGSGDDPDRVRPRLRAALAACLRTPREARARGEAD